MKAEVTGINSGGRKIHFELTGPLIIHIRRMASFYERNNPDLEGGFNKEILRKFRRFGRINHTKVDKEVREEIMNVRGVCVDCGIDEDLTLDHVQRRCAGGTNKKSNLEVVCRTCHDIREYKRAMEIKYLQIKEYKKRINNLEATRDERLRSQTKGRTLQLPEVRSKTE